MENNEKLDISKYLDMLVRRKYWLIISFMVTFVAGTGYLLHTPKIYESSTLILVQPQKVPENFVQSLVTSDAGDRLRTITQQVTSRTNLESLIEKYNLYGSQEEQGMLIDDKVEVCRKNISINVAAKRSTGDNAFSISFQGKDPRKIMEVTNALASNFMSENLRIRESQSIGTSSFLAEELNSVEKELMAKEEQLKKYKERNMGALPEQLNSNLRILGNFQAQVERLTTSLNAAENRKLVLQQNLAAMGVDIFDPSGQSLSGGSDPLSALKARRVALLTKYTEKHPDIINLNKQIAAIEQEMAQKSEAIENETSSEKTSGKASSPAEVAPPLAPQLAQINVEIARLKDDIEKVKKENKMYEKRVEETPEREQELLSLNRDYGSLSASYSNLLNRKRAAELSVSMERKQKGEQFKVIDPAKVALRPSKPDAQKIMLLTIALGLGIGCGLIYLAEIMDTSYRSPEETEKDLSLPVLISMPFLMTPKEINREKIKNIVIATSLSAGFIITLFGIVVSAKGLDITVNYVTGLFTGV